MLFQGPEIYDENIMVFQGPAQHVGVLYLNNFNIMLFQGPEICNKSMMVFQGPAQHANNKIMLFPRPAQAG